MFLCWLVGSFFHIFIRTRIKKILKMSASPITYTIFQAPCRVQSIVPIHNPNEKFNDNRDNIFHLDAIFAYQWNAL